jgi:hypothetical protein
VSDGLFKKHKNLFLSTPNLKSSQEV